MKIIGKSLVWSEVASGNGDDGRTSEKLTKDTGESEISLSVHTVMSNEDLLIEILLRLPVVSLLLFKTVSKHWLSLIKSPNFTSRLSRIPSMAPPSGIFLKRHKKIVQYEFLSLDSRIPSKRATPFSFCSEADGSVQILNSCNGLLLCRSIKYPYKLYVYNPSINLFKMLPLLQNLIDTGFREIMAFDPAKSPHYKVLSPEHKANGIQIHTYSSETRNWSACGQLFPRKIFCCFCDGIYWNDAIHWPNVLTEIPLHVKLDLVGYTVSTTKPPRTLATTGTFNFKLFQSRGYLLLLWKQYTHSRQLVVYEMRNWNSGWSVKYLINLDDIMSPFPECWDLRDYVWCIVLREKEEDSFMVIKVNGKVVQYKPVLKTSRELCKSGSISSQRCSYEFTASFAGV